MNTVYWVDHQQLQIHGSPSCSVLQISSNGTEQNSHRLDALIQTRLIFFRSMGHYDLLVAMAFMKCVAHSNSLN